ncbi:MAG: OsmC family protein [Chitinophagaceae bacterium]
MNKNPYPEVQAHIGLEKYPTLISAGSNSLVADEPYHQGGKNLGPEPSELLLSALGSCTAMTLRMYADRKNWPLEWVNVRLQLIPEKDQGGTGITREISMGGPLSMEQKSRLMAIADKCPTHLLLTHPISIHSALVESE